MSHDPGVFLLGAACACAVAFVTFCLKVVARSVRQRWIAAQAKAWDSGFAAYFQEDVAKAKDPNRIIRRENPYRSAP